MSEKNIDTIPTIRFHDVSIIFLQCFYLGGEINLNQWDTILSCSASQKMSDGQGQEQEPKSNNKSQTYRDKPDTDYSFTEHFKKNHTPITFNLKNVNLNDFPEIPNETSIKEFLKQLKTIFPFVKENEYKIQAKKEDLKKKFYFNFKKSEKIKIDGKIEIRFSKSGVACIRTWINPKISTKKANLNVKEIVFLTNYLINAYMRGKAKKHYKGIINEKKKEISEFSETSNNDNSLEVADTYIIILVNGSDPPLFVHKLTNFNEKKEISKINKIREEIVSLSVRSPIWPPCYHREYLEEAIGSNLSFRDDEFIFIEDLNTLIYRPSLAPLKKEQEKEFDFRTQYDGYVKDIIRLIEMERMERVALHKYEDLIDSKIKEIMEKLKSNNGGDILTIKIPMNAKTYNKLLNDILIIKKKFREVKDTVDMLEIDRNFGIKHFRLMAERMIKEFGLLEYLSSIERKIAYVDRIRETIQNAFSDKINTDIQKKILLLQLIFLLGIAIQIAGLLWVKPTLEKIIAVLVLSFILFYLIRLLSQWFFKTKRPLKANIKRFFREGLNKVILGCKKLLHLKSIN